MDDRELIIDALRKTEAAVRMLEGDDSERAEHALRVRAELEDNADYVVKGGGA